jgi:hypothetical protein
VDSDTELISVNGKTTASLIYFDVATALSTPSWHTDWFVLKQALKQCQSAKESWKNPRRFTASRLSSDPSVDSDTELISVNGKTTLRWSILM